MLGSYNFGGNQAPARGAQTRGRIQGSGFNGLAYPNPFFDVAQTYLPTSVKELFKHCRYQFMTNGHINTVCHRLAEYPITDIIIDHPDQNVKEKWENLLHDTLRIRSHQVDSGVDYQCYGNSFTTISYPFVKQLICKNCKFTEKAELLRPHYQWTNLEFILACPKCGHSGAAGVHEQYYKDVSNLRLVRISPEDIEVTHNDLTGRSTYYFQVPAAIRGDIMVGKREIVETVPQVFIQALRQQKGIVWQKENFYHMKRPTIAFQDRGWGFPLILPVLKDAFQLQLLKKACEAILLEHIIPLRTMFPQAASGTSDPFVSVNLTEWKEQMAAEIARWRIDPSYIPILPLPIGTQTLGGDGKALLLFQEIQNQIMFIIEGMGVPREFVQGGLSFSGSNVSMRMLENNLLGYMIDQKHQLRWIMQSLATYLDWPLPKARFKPFKMADDLQRKMYYLQLNQAQKLSDTTLLADSDFDQKTEDEIRRTELKQRMVSMREEQLATAELQGEMSVIAAKYQAKAQKAQQEAMGALQAPGEPGGDPSAMDPAQAQQQAQEGADATQAAAMQGAPVATAPDPTQAIPGAAPSDVRLGGMPAEAQNALTGNRLQSGSQAVDLQQLAASYAQQLSGLAPAQRDAALQALAAQSPELAQLVQQLLTQMGVTDKAQAKGPKSPKLDGRPLPEQRAPRRDNPSI